jgi:hypothetical protein
VLLELAAKAASLRRTNSYGRMLDRTAFFPVAIDLYHNILGERRRYGDGKA